MVAVPQTLPSFNEHTRVVIGPGQKILTRIGSGRVSHLWYGYGFGKFPLKLSNFSIFCPSGKNVIGSGQKVPGSEPGRPLINCGSKVCWGCVRAHLYTRVFPNNVKMRFSQKHFPQHIFSPN